MHYDRRLGSKTFPAAPLFLAWCAVCVILIISALPRILANQYPDPDDILRLVQVRDLLAGQAWFDPMQYRINPPEGTPTHWSRLVDAPLLLLIAALTPIFGQPTAESITVIVVPLLTFLLTVSIIARLAWRLLGTRVAIFAVFASGFLPPILFQYQPLRIDHHGWQAASVAIAIWAISWRSSVKGGALAGFALAVGLNISLEILPMTVAFAGVLFIRWLRDQSERLWLTSFMAAFALSLAIGHLMSRGVSLIEYCDAISPGHVVFFLVAAGGTAVIAKLNNMRSLGLLVLFACIGAAALAAFSAMSPQCMATPFARLDPWVDSYWYQRVLEGQPLHRRQVSGYLPLLIQFSAATIATVVLMLRSRDWKRQFWTEYLIILIASIILTLLVARSQIFTSVLAAIPLGWLAVTMFDRFKSAENFQGKLASLIAIAAIFAPTAPLTLMHAIMPTESAKRFEAASLNRSSCLIRDEAVRLNVLPTGLIFAPLDVSPSILLRSEHSVVATGHHRAEDAMSSVIRAYTAPADEARAIIAAHNADYMALCANLTEPLIYENAAPDGLMADLRARNIPAWLEPVEVGGDENFLVFKIRD